MKNCIIFLLLMLSNFFYPIAVYGQVDLYMHFANNSENRAYQPDGNWTLGTILADGWFYQLGRWPEFQPDTVRCPKSMLNATSCTIIAEKYKITLQCPFSFLWPTKIRMNSFDGKRVFFDFTTLNVLKEYDTTIQIGSLEFKLQKALITHFLIPHDTVALSENKFSGKVEDTIYILQQIGSYRMILYNYNKELVSYYLRADYHSWLNTRSVFRQKENKLIYKYTKRNKILNISF